jgi:uncharacterized protein with NAD-binding domain and iron-sulfur cluster
MPEPHKPRVVILGGGVGAMTAAFELSRPGWQEHYASITVYQLGWRLGGKGASGREEPDQRITEHGLHIWLGFYENAFRMLRECYNERRTFSAEPFATVDEAFERASTFVVRELTDEGWKPWIATFPEDDQVPGDPDDPSPLPTTWEYLHRCIQLAIRFLLSVTPPPSDLAASAALRLESPAEGDVAVRPFEERGISALRQALREGPRLITADPGRLLGVSLGWALDVLDRVAIEGLEEASERWAVVDDVVERFVRGAKDALRDRAFESDATRRSWYLADILLACARGILRHGLLDHPAGFDAIDHYDFADWLVINGADEESARCALIKAVVYDIAFAYRDGDCRQPSFSAAAALRGLFRWFFTYKGAIAWRMRAGMGDVVFTPIFQVLEHRGVDFRFFHRVDALHATPDGRSIASITISRQAELRDPSGTYRPLVEVRGLRCWPAQPLWDQLTDGDRLRDGKVNFESFWCPEPPVETFELDVRGDIVVLGIALGALPFLCPDLVARSARWRNMIDHLATVQTQAFQLWLTEPMNELTLMDHPQATMGGYIEPFDTCADLSQLVERENVSPRPKAIAYFCNSMPTRGLPDPAATSTPEDAHDRVRAAVLRFLREDMIALWPGAVRRYPTDFRWEVLVAPAGTEGPARLEHQFWKANVDPSDRYVMALPGTLRYRLHPGDSGFLNLFPAGDWTRCGINAGCVEAAVISGMLAANAIQGVPAIPDIVGYDQP